ncbi:MAG TPA: serine hydrolase domain-containing protein [Acidimicrobiia bacterium]|nr:serine hydrolase domain-containing protein [Acidimicrobiia bacterium]
MKAHHGRGLALALLVALAACASTPSGTETSTPVDSTVAPPASTEPTEPAARFPIATFAAITEDPVPADLAAELQSILEDLAGEAGVSATVMSAHGTWSGATGKADGVRDVTVNDQFSIASTTKAVTAAQVMQLVEAGELGLDDLAADHLPSDLDFDTNGATIRHLLGHRSGIPDYFQTVTPQMVADPLRFWTPAALLAEIPADRTTAGAAHEYGNINYVLLGLVIEEVTGRRVVEVLRDGVLGIDGVERLIYQPDEIPTQPIAMENGQPTDVLETVGGFLPSLALTSDGPAAAMASDSVSLGRWWRALCAGEIVSQASLIEMTTMQDGYGLGLAEIGPPGTVGHGGADLGNNAMVGCLPESGVVFAVLANRSNDVVDTRVVAGSLVRAVDSP